MSCYLFNSEKYSRHIGNNDKLNAEYTNQLVSIGRTDTIIAGISK
jgi:hypothetical protein